MNTTDALLARDNRTPPDYAPDHNGRLCCIVPSHNYGKFIEQTIESLLAQTRPADEVIVLDDCSTDDTLARIEKYKDKVRILKNRTNLKLPATRNRAIALTDAEFIISVDADDWCEPTYFETLVNALKADPTLGVAYTSVKTWVEPEQRFRVRRLWPPQFDWDWTAQRSDPPRTMIPASAMYRREMWRRAGGFMESLDRAEDAEFWIRGLSVGFGVKKVSDEELYVWRFHGTNASNDQPSNDVHAWLPFLWGAPIPSGAPTPRAVKRDYTQPAISVIVTVGPFHGKYAASAIESIIGQTFWNWQLIIVNDSGQPLDTSRYPFANVITTEGRTGASHARNVGLAEADAPFVVFLDGDDFLHPFALQRMAQMWARIGHGFVYTDLFEYIDERGNQKPEVIARQLHTADPNVLQFYNGITALMLKADAQAVGGFDEGMKDGGEDKDFYLKLRAYGGVFAHRLAEPLFYYRVRSGFLRNRANSQEIGDQLELLFKERYDRFGYSALKGIPGSEPMASCCGGDSGAAIIELKRSLQGLPSLPTVPTKQGMVLMQFIGNETGEVTYFGKYTAANNDTSRFLNVEPNDVERLSNTGKFVVSERTMPAEPATAPIVATEPPVDPYFDEASLVMPPSVASYNFAAIAPEPNHDHTEAMAFAAKTSADTDEIKVNPNVIEEAKAMAKQAARRPRK